MHDRLRRAIAYLLLVLMPLQALAVGVVVACPVEAKQFTATDVAMENCDDPTMVHTGLPDNHAQPNATNDPHHVFAPCGMSSNCFALASIGLLPATRMLAIEPAFSPIGFADSFYRSHIPEGLQRPPQSIHS